MYCGRDVQTDVCEMIDVSSNGEDTQEKRCTTPAIGMTEDGTRVCERHGRAAVIEDFIVSWDKAP